MHPKVSKAQLTIEAGQTPHLIETQNHRNAASWETLGQILRENPPVVVVTCARGSSDYAANYGKYLIETQLGIPVASLGPSIASLYSSKLYLSDAVFIAVSQSGRSPDIIQMTKAARKAGAKVIAMVNDETSPLFDLCDFALPICAGEEKSIAATKSYSLSCMNFLSLVAHWTQNGELLGTLRQASASIERAQNCDWREALLHFREANNLYVIGRGLSLSAAQEVALKFKETCEIHAEAFSSAEVIHGPLALLKKSFPVVALGIEDASAVTFSASVARMAQLSDNVWSTLAIEATHLLPTPASVPALLMPLCQIQSFYLALAKLAFARGLNPDSPAQLQKITQTV